MSEEMTPRERAYAVAATALVNESREVIASGYLSVSKKMARLKAIIKLHNFLIDRARLIDGCGMSAAERFIEENSKSK